MTPGNSKSHKVEMKLGKEIEFLINEKPYKVSSDVPPETSLNTYIREYAHLKGTKFMCYEGGCGACIVNVEFNHPKTKQKVIYAANSCLVPIFSCHGWHITTVEGIGNFYKGYHKVQQRLAAANGTQCGYCTPGMVMNMYSLLQSNPAITMKEIENSFGGNICRCTGYRPILDAFKSLASDAPSDLIKKLQDIEELTCPKTGKICAGVCEKNCSTPLENQKCLIHLTLEDGAQWFRPVCLKEIFEIFDMIGDKSYRIIAGNTGQGVYRITEPPSTYIDINGVPEMYGYEIRSDGIYLDANINLTEAMELFYKLAKEKPNQFSYCKMLGDHIDLIANVPVRNIGTLAGNIMLKHDHHEFPSDIVLLLETVGAQFSIMKLSGMEKTVDLDEFLKMNMDKCLLFRIILPILDPKEYFVTTYKIMPRAQNAHAFVNAGFRIKADKNNKFKILEKPTILFGGINPSFLHCSKLEEYLNQKILLEKSVLKESLNILESELKPNHELPDPTPEFRKGLAQSLFYKFVLSMSPDGVKPKFKSGGTLLERPLSSGKQDFDTNEKLWPLNKPIPKIEALMQCSGEAEYTNDIPHMPGQLWAQLVLCDRGAATVKDIDASDALKIKGVVAFYSAKDIPAENNFSPLNMTNMEPEPLFVEKGKRTNYAGEAVGVIVAESSYLAITAAPKIKIKYDNPEDFMINTRHIIDNNITSRIIQLAKIDAKEKNDDVKYKIEGRWDLGPQYHYTMETQTCVVVPTEDKDFDVYASSQWAQTAQEGVSIVLGIPENRITIKTRRLGGGYGSKISRANGTICACAVAAFHLNRPVRLILNLETNMEWAGKRFPVFANYDLGVNENGKIQYMNIDMYEDDGHSRNDVAMTSTVHHLQNCYDNSTWTITGYGVKTNSASNTWCRAPGTTEATSVIETIMDHIAKVLKKDPIAVRLENINKSNPIPQMIEDIKVSSDYVKRVAEIEQFNNENRWKKRGIALMPIDYLFFVWGNFYGVVSIFRQDGSVSITHGGVEMGQGINTKAVQVAAYVLNIDVDNVSVKPTTNNITPNNVPTGGSLGSEAVCYAIKKSCEEINERLKPVKEKLGEKATWKEIIQKAYDDNINLNASYMFTQNDDLKNYNIYGVAVTEVEIDVLTGQFQTTRADLIEDAGQSLSPEVDIGQVEGAFVMGLGYYTSEELVYNPDSGALLTNRTWNYKPPGAKDIPIDFRVTLRKKAFNTFGLFGSKATGEPPLNLSHSVIMALRNAIESARKDAGHDEDWFDLELPYTGEKIWLGTLTNKDLFDL